MRGAALAFCAAALTAQTPDCGLFPGSKLMNQSRAFEGDNLYDYINGNSEGYLIYGFVRMKGVTCEKGEVRYNIDISEFKDAESAYGMLTSVVDAGRPMAAIGTGGQVVPQKTVFVKDKYFVEISAEPDGDYAAELSKTAATVAQRIQGTSTPPVELSWFPAENRTPRTMPRLIPQSVLGIRILERGYVGSYANGKAFVVNEGTPEKAGALLARLQERFTDVKPAQAGAEGFTGVDKYLGKLCIFRKGSRVAGWTNVPESVDAAKLAAAFAARLP